MSDRLPRIALRAIVRHGRTGRQRAVPTRGSMIYPVKLRLRKAETESLFRTPAVYDIRIEKISALLDKFTLLL